MNQSEDQKLFYNYLQKQRKEKVYVFTWQWVLFILFFGFWEVASRNYWIDPLIFSSPSRVLILLYEKISDGSLFIHVQMTLFETILGFILGTLLGIVLASILWFSNRLANILDPYLVVLNAMPKVALGPILIVALGPGLVSIVMMGVIVSVIITTIVIYTAFNEVDPNYMKVLQSFGANRWQCFKEAIFKATLPTMISTLKVNVGLSWVGVIVGEFLVSKQGLGYLIIYGFQVFDFTLVMASLLIIAMIAAVMYKGVEKLENRWIKHSL